MDDDVMETLAGLAMEFVTLDDLLHEEPSGRHVDHERRQEHRGTLKRQRAEVLTKMRQIVYAEKGRSR